MQIKSLTPNGCLEGLLESFEGLKGLPNELQGSFKGKKITKQQKKREK